MLGQVIVAFAEVTPLGGSGEQPATPPEKVSMPAGVSESVTVVTTVTSPVELATQPASCVQATIAMTGAAPPPPPSPPGPPPSSPHPRSRQTRSSLFIESSRRA